MATAGSSARALETTLFTSAFAAFHLEIVHEVAVNCERADAFSFWPDGSELPHIGAAGISVAIGPEADGVTETPVDGCAIHSDFLAVLAKD